MLSYAPTLRLNCTPSHAHASRFFFYGAVGKYESPL